MGEKSQHPGTNCPWSTQEVLSSLMDLTIRQRVAVNTNCLFLGTRQMHQWKDWTGSCHTLCLLVESLLQGQEWQQMLFLWKVQAAFLFMLITYYFLSHIVSTLADELLFQLQMIGNISCESWKVTTLHNHTPRLLF